MITFKFRNKLTGMQFIALGFFLLILVGTFLLMLPISTKAGESTDFMTALFTSTSATCVTGLVLTDTFTHWTLFGQLVLLALIQIGGLGFITIGVSASLAFHKKIGLKTRGNLQDSVSALQLGGIVKLVMHILKGTFLFEGIGAILLSIRFIPKMGFITGIYYGIFHSISAFCNAGFDLMGCFSPGSSFTAYSGDWLVCITLILLIVIGGIGFVVWENIYVHKLNFRRYSLHAKMVLSFSVFLILTGAVLFFFAERNNTLLGMPLHEQILCSLFGSITPRTAGFNTVDNAALTDAGKFLSIVLMFIGGAPGSTAGGVKVTTIFVLILYLRSTLTHTRGVNIFGRRLTADTVSKAACVLFLNLSLSMIVGFIICCSQNFTMADTLFEVVSAISTVGMSAGLTGQLNLLSQLLIIFLMYIGRVGSLSFALAFTDKKKTAHIMQPEEAINVG
ncbi:Trk family potassium uptake protein [Roseburia hominis]|uniref:potassium transporter TrkG n=1 Tax=Roseburia hominis TaxID=301301 RepID=UPI001F1C61CF|nr:Trk family potassium uptake protein [Roseburia hominis]